MNVKQVIANEQKRNSKRIKEINHDKEVRVQNQEQEDFKKAKLLEYVNGLSDAQKKIALKQIAYKKARNSYEEYVKLCYADQGFICTKFHHYLCMVLENVVRRVENGERVRLVISVPPRHGKTWTTTETLPSWFVGRNPTKHAILCAYNSDLATDFCDRNRQKTREYGKEVFGLTISETQDNKDKYEIETYKGGVMGVGVQGGITGNGAEIIIVDDPYKNGLEANNYAFREKIMSVFNDSIYTRLQGKGNALIVIQTRWHENDLAGILSQDSDFIVINIPCVCDDLSNPIEKYLGRTIGQTLCPELGFDANWAENTKKRVGLRVWNALYQGKPTIDGGNIFKRDMIKHYDKASLPANFDEVVMSCDLSFGGTKSFNDPCAIQVWGRVGANHYLLNRVKKRMTFNEMCNMIKVLSATFPLARRKIIEKKANGQAVIDSLNSVVGGFEAYDPKNTDKIARANAILPYLESGNVFFPNKEIDDTIDEFEEEMLKFPNGAHDDEVDAMTQYLVCYEYRNSGRICTDSYYTSISDIFRGVKL